MFSNSGRKSGSAGNGGNDVDGSWILGRGTNATADGGYVPSVPRKTI